MANKPYALAAETVEFLRLKLPDSLAKPRVAVVCGSGLGGLAECVDQSAAREVWEYKDVPNFPVSTGRLSLYLKSFTERGQTGLMLT